MPVRCLALMLVLLSVCPCVATDQSPDDVLKTKGLTRSGSYVLLDDDAKLPASLKDMYTALRKMEASDRKRKEIEKDIHKTEDTIAALNEQRMDLADKLEKYKNQEGSYNRVVREYNAIVAPMRDGLKYLEKRRKDLQAVPDNNEEYIQAVLSVSQKVDDLSRKYNELKADALVVDAIATLNQGSTTPVKLGPSDRLSRELPALQKLREQVTPSKVPLQVAGGVAYTPVVINGTLKVEMLVDSGASYVTLSADVAEKLDLKPGPKDPTLKLSIANGKVITGRLMKLSTIRLSQFIVEDVECVVFPPGVQGSNLLGGTFLRNFVYNMDLTGGTMKLSQISGAPSGEQKQADSADVPKTSPKESLADSSQRKPKVPGTTEVVVPATNNVDEPVRTGIRLKAGQLFKLEPNKTDSWSGGGTRKGKTTDYRGYTPGKAGWCTMHWMIGNTRSPVSAGAELAAPESGELLLYCEDVKSEDNDGSIRVNVITRPIKQ